MEKWIKSGRTRTVQLYGYGVIPILKNITLYINQEWVLTNSDI